MATAKQIMDTAASYIGVKESPAGSNKVCFNTDYYGYEASGEEYKWCCSFIWDIFRLCGASELFYDGQKTAYCPAVASWGQPLKVGKSDGRYGDIVLYDRGKDGVADHIGLIESRNAEGSYNAIEGNTSLSSNSNGGEVMRRVRYQSSILAIIRPQYEQEAAEQTPVAAETTEKQGGTCTVELSVLRKGSKGDAVKALQILLIGNGYSCGSCGADGDFGGGTYAAVTAYQAAKGLDVDGVVGAQTWGSLLK